MSLKTVPLQTILHIAEPPAGDPKLAKEHQRLIGLADELERGNRESEKARREYLASLESNPDGFGGVIFDGMNFRAVEVGNIQRELKLRTELVPYLTKWSEWARGEEKSLAKQLAEIQEWVIQYCVAGGWHDPAKFPLSPSRVIPRFWLDHPRWRAADEARKALGIALERRPLQLNEAGIIELRRILREASARLAGIPVT